MTKNQCLQEKLDSVCKEPTGIRKKLSLRLLLHQMTSENGNAKSDQLDDRKFLIPREHIKRNKKKRNQVITGKGASTGNVMGAP